MSKLTIKQLKQQCDDQGIKYTAKVKHQDLVDLLAGKKVKPVVGKPEKGEY